MKGATPSTDGDCYRNSDMFYVPFLMHMPELFCSPCFQFYMKRIFYVSQVHAEDNILLLLAILSLLVKMNS